MLRIARIMGVVVFALLIGFSANSLKGMHESGELYETYNSRWRADVTLIGISSLAIIGLCYWELTRLRRLNNRKRYGQRRFGRDTGEGADGLDSTNIYATPKSVDDWNGRKIRSSNNYKAPPAKATGDGFWMGLLRIMCLVLPLLYTGLLIYNLKIGNEDPLIAILMPSVFSILLVLAVFTAIGILRKKTWGITMGYVLAICNLLIFPYGTATGMFLMIGLVGASSSFEVNKKQSSRSRASSRTRTQAV